MDFEQWTMWTEFFDCYPSNTHLYECAKCGAVVVSRQTHYEWHNREGAE